MDWVFKCYGEVKKDLHSWRKVLDLKSQARWDNMLDYLVQSPKEQWAQTNYFYPLHGKECKQLFEVRFKWKNVQYRPIGFFGPDKGSFTFVLYAKEIGGKFEPKNACEAAQRNRASAVANPGLCYECDF